MISCCILGQQSPFYEFAPRLLENKFFLLKREATIKMAELLPLYPSTHDHNEPSYKDLQCIFSNRIFHSVYWLAELQIRGGIEDNLKITFLIFQPKHNVVTPH